MSEQSTYDQMTGKPKKLAPHYPDRGTDRLWDERKIPVVHVRENPDEDSEKTDEQLTA